jgi:hypothetical protein
VITGLAREDTDEKARGLIPPNLQFAYPGDVASYGRVGTVETIENRPAAFDAAGVQELIVNFADPSVDPVAQIRRTIPSNSRRAFTGRRHNVCQHNHLGERRHDNTNTPHHYHRAAHHRKPNQPELARAHKSATPAGSRVAAPWPTSSHRGSSREFSTGWRWRPARSTASR